ARPDGEGRPRVRRGGSPYSGRTIGVDWEFLAGRSAVEGVSVEPIGPGASCERPISLLLPQPARSAPAMISEAASAGVLAFISLFLPCSPVMERPSPIPVPRPF